MSGYFLNSCVTSEECNGGYMGNQLSNRVSTREKINLFTQFLALCVLTSAVGILLSGCGQPGSVRGEPSVTQQSATPVQPQPALETALPSRTVTKIINVNETYKADVIIVIDNSASMRFEQANMAQRFSSLLEEMKGLDWRLGIITTDVSRDQAKKDGRFLEFAGLPGVYHLSSDMDLEVVKAAFGATIQRPSREGHANEQGIKATYRALERKPEWLRGDDASLNVVVVTDADETPYKGKAEIRNNPSDLLKYVNTQFPGKPFFFHSIIVKEGDETCLKNSDNEGYGRTYAWLSEKTGGIIGNVCQEDYSNQLKMIGEKVSQQIKSVALECAPLEGSMLIKTGATDLLIADFEIHGLELRLGQPLPAGQTEITYQCAQ